MQFCFQEYEDQSSAEAKFVKDLDRYDMIFQVNIFSWLNFAMKVNCTSVFFLLRKYKGLFTVTGTHYNILGTVLGVGQSETTPLAYPKGAPWTCAPHFRSNFIHFMQFSGGKWPNNRLPSPPLQLALPPGKSWIRH